jgi:hypothetical protein
VQDMPAQRASHAVSNASGRHQHVSTADRHTHDGQGSTQWRSSGDSDSSSSSTRVSSLTAQAHTWSAQTQVLPAAAPLGQYRDPHAAHPEAQEASACNTR